MDVVYENGGYEYMKWCEIMLKNSYFEFIWVVFLIFFLGEIEIYWIKELFSLIKLGKL